MCKLLFQDGALFVFNDAEFTEDDWEGITSPGFSQKKEKVDKVGRFGIGFSSVYHLTGPLIFSSDAITFHSIYSCHQGWLSDEEFQILKMLIASAKFASLLFFH